MLLLEEEALYRASIKDIVKKNSNLAKTLTIYDASTVEEALSITENKNITHAIAAIDLGQTKNGFDFIKEIKEKHPEVSCMVHTNRHLAEDNIKAKELGVKAYVPKPLSIDHLVLFLANADIENNDFQ